MTWLCALSTQLLREKAAINFFVLVFRLKFNVNAWNRDVNRKCIYKQYICCVRANCWALCMSSLLDMNRQRCCCESLQMFTFGRKLLIEWSLYIDCSCLWIFCCCCCSRFGWFYLLIWELNGWHINIIRFHSSKNHEFYGSWITETWIKWSLKPISSNMNKWIDICHIVHMARTWKLNSKRHNNSSSRYLNKNTYWLLLLSMSIDATRKYFDWFLYTFQFVVRRRARSVYSLARIFLVEFNWNWRTIHWI